VRGFAGEGFETSVAPPPSSALTGAGASVAGWLPPPRTLLSGWGLTSGAGERSIAVETVVLPKAAEAFAAGKEMGPASAPKTRSQR
jgi:hypothetical protein